jgi:hypothetical protein
MTFGYGIDAIDVRAKINGAGPFEQSFSMRGFDTAEQSNAIEQVA